MCATAIVICVATVLIGSESRCKGHGPRGCVRYCHCDLRSNGSRQSLWKGLRRAESPLGPPAVVCATAIVICIATVLTGSESHCKGRGTDVCKMSLCATTIAISIARVLTGSESQCNGCGPEVGKVCLCATAIVICTARAINACESQCKCCGEGVGEACLCATAIVICSSLV